MFKPRFKLEHRPYRTRAGTVRIGGGVYGLAAEIEDPDGWLWTLIRATDGTRVEQDIVAEVCRAHPAVSDDDVRAGLEQLTTAGHVEDAGADPPADLTSREQERYRRGSRYYSWVDLTPRSSPWEVQQRLKRAKVVVLGVGGTGGSAALALAASGIGHLHCVDADVVELSNLNRQILYTEDDLGKAKVEATVARLRRLNSDIEVTGEQRRIGSQQDIADVIEGCDVLAQCADQPADIRRWANLACLTAGIPWADGGYRGPMLTAGGYQPGVGACWECLREAESTSPPDTEDHERSSPELRKTPSRR
ncbi:HesA/MoeB/ThiF family protein [Phytohabitans rumicis]|uniref:Thiamine/molybdopterin biosynthesis protein n=1 Tax=Phytohabitans rumicis TaxID=1076125 RepID=A0A6V8KZK7_9ACTN|nr:ThiF family adenylyltransferase [Phytohabitans rumicis]GFJ87277.1 thiamine/molybdopterin biosynthesis protein [Phytohabitans rumicis]